MAVKASPDEQALLLDLQALDIKLQQLAHRAKSLPEHGALQQLAVEASALALTVAEQSGAVEDAKLELTRVESDVAVVEARIARDSARLQSTSSVKDVQALEQELAALRKRQFDLEEIELVVMQRLEDNTGELAKTTEQMDALRTRISQVEGERDEALRAIEAERSNAVANRTTIAAKVPAELLALYDKQRARYGWGASHLRGGVSSASGVRLTESDMLTIRAAAPDDVLLCPDSNAILVRTSESGM